MGEPQKEPVSPARTDVGGAGVPTMPGPVTGPGGWTSLINQDEKAITDSSFQNTPCEYVGYQDDARVGGDV